MATSQNNNDNPQPLPASLRAMRAALRGHETPEQLTEQPAPGKAPAAEEAFPVSAKIREVQAATVKDVEPEVVIQALNQQSIKGASSIGQEIKDENGKSKGIYLGMHKIKDGVGKLVGTFNLYAAPEDLKKKNWISKRQLLMNFHGAASYTAALKDFHGYDGFNHGLDKGSDKTLFQAMRAGTYHGEWFIPSIDILEHLYSYKDAGALAGTFNDKYENHSSVAYWASTEKPGNPDQVCAKNFATGGIADWNHKSHYTLSTRLVRAEPVGKTTQLPAVGIRNIN